VAGAAALGEGWAAAAEVAWVWAEGWDGEAVAAWAEAWVGAVRWPTRLPPYKPRQPRSHSLTLPKNSPPSRPRPEW